MRALLKGRQPIELTPTRLLRLSKDLPHDWSEQGQFLVSRATILVSDLIRGLIRGLGHKLTPVGELTLKGLPEPVSAFAVEWTPRRDSDDVIPLPPKIAPVPSFELFGRTREQAIIERCWSAAKEGQRQVVLLAGEPGIGKTRLAFEAGRNAHDQGAIVLLGTCDEEGPDVVRVIDGDMAKYRRTAKRHENAEDKGQRREGRDAEPKAEP